VEDLARLDMVVTAHAAGARTSTMSKSAVKPTGEECVNVEEAHRVGERQTAASCARKTSPITLFR
jgi:hypothetical protein